MDEVGDFKKERGNVGYMKRSGIWLGIQMRCMYPSGIVNTKLKLLFNLEQPINDTSLVQCPLSLINQGIEQKLWDYFEKDTRTRFYLNNVSIHWHQSKIVTISRVTLKYHQKVIFGILWFACWNWILQLLRLPTTQGCTLELQILLWLLL